MKKLVSEKQLAANRRNAQNSTGPKTPSGKSASRLNAVKHGLLARQIVARGFWYQESSKEFKQLSHEFYQNLAPEGPLEEMLVGQIIAAVWRLRRVRTAEAGEVAKNVDDNWDNPKLRPWSAAYDSQWNALTQPVVDEVQTPEAINHLVECLRELRQAIETAGEFTEKKLAEYKCSSSEPNEIIVTLEKMRKKAASNPDNVPAGELRARILKEMLDYLDYNITYFHRLVGARQTQMDAEDRMRRAASLMPQEPVVEKIVRYESALQRQLYRSMNQLERLQRRRLGENVPPPVVMDVSLRA